MTHLLPNLRIVGISLLALSMAHVLIAKHLEWKTDLVHLMPVNRQIFYSHTFFICLMLAMLGVICLLFPHSLMTRTPLARLVLAGLVIFWTLRLIFQWFIYDSKLWRGNRTNTIIHIIFTMLWSYYILVFAAALRWQ